MKNLINMLMAVTLTAFIFTGCVEDGCDVTGCQNDGVCVNNVCDCPEGFRGDECEDVIDPCENVSCDGEQTCDNGVCGCTNGFEGIDCDVLAVAKFIGNWDATDDCPSAVGEPNGVWLYEAAINPDVDDQTQVKVFNFGGFGMNFAWTTSVSGDTIRIPLSDVGGFVAEGEGIMSEDKTTINWTYTVTDADNNSEECNGVWLRL